MLVVIYFCFEQMKDRRQKRALSPAGVRAREGLVEKGPFPLERGAVLKKGGDYIRVALCYPNYYEMAMGNLGFHHAYHLFNLEEDVACERVTKSYLGRAPVSIESGRPLREFEIVAFSMSYESDLLNMIRILNDAGLPLGQEERNSSGCPLVLLGGVTAFLNPEPAAPFVDLAAIGEAEVIVPLFLDRYRELRGSPKPDLIRELGSVEGIYAPSLYALEYGEDQTILCRRPLSDSAPERIMRAVCQDPEAPLAITRVFTGRAEFCDMALVEISRGCARGCRFCAGSFVYRPPRYFEEARIREELGRGFRERDKAGLIAATAADHPGFDSLRNWIGSMHKTHSVSSLRLDEVTPELLEDIRSCGHKTVTLAPEAGSERLRLAANKPITDEEILSAMEMVGASDIPRLKLYFQVGLPFEEEDDVEAIVRLMEKIKAALARGWGKRNWAAAVNVSINPFVPKPSTPFQWVPMAGTSYLKKSLKFLRESLAKLGGVSVSSMSAREAMNQALIARGDGRLAAALIKAVKTGKGPSAVVRRGFAYSPDAWWYVHRERGRDEVLPWDFIEHGVSKDYLWEEYVKAGKAKTTPPCSPGRCSRCEACKTER